jgi:hypothetical protein
MLSIFTGSYHRVRGAYRSHKLDTQRETIAVFRTSRTKPAKVRSLARSQRVGRARSSLIFSALQVVGLLVVAVWTINNYIHLIKEL